MLHLILYIFNNAFNIFYINRSASKMRSPLPPQCGAQLGTISVGPGSQSTCTKVCRIGRGAQLGAIGPNGLRPALPQWLSDSDRFQTGQTSVDAYTSGFVILIALPTIPPPLQKKTTTNKTKNKTKSKSTK